MSAASYYNEIDPYAARWLRNLIAAGHIAPGDVDERSIVDVRPDDLRGYRQCHFFAGIGVWSYALRLAMTRPTDALSREDIEDWRRRLKAFTDPDHLPGRYDAAMDALCDMALASLSERATLPEAWRISGKHILTTYTEHADVADSWRTAEGVKVEPLYVAPSPGNDREQGGSK